MTHYHGGTDWQEGGGEGPEPHLPDCYIVKRDGFVMGPCICTRLRACEARVREEEQAAATLEIAHKTGEHYAYGRADALTQMLDAGNVMGQEFYAKGYAAALDAARDAVAAKWCCSCCVGQITDALAAIDALRGERT